MKKILLLTVLLASHCLAQKSTYFHLEFTVKELDGEKTANTRSYKTTVETGGNCSIRVGDKIPIQSGGNSTYLDVGVNIDCKSVTLRDDEVTMYVSADISSIASETRPPIVHNLKWSAPVVVHIGRPTIVFSSDGPSGKHQTQLEVTITPIA